LPPHLLRAPVRAIPEEEQRLLEAIQGVARTMKRWIGAEMRREGLTGPMFWTLHTVALEGPVNIGQLAEACSVTSANASMVTDELARAGLIERRRSQADRRVVQVVATAKGRALQRAVWARVGARLLSPVQGTEEREIAAAARVLQKMVDAAPPGGRFGGAA
jgi:DNA-binding MarR family transcriptional regulator